MKKKQQIRSKFRKDVFGRDNNTCLVCGHHGGDEDFDAHHITDRNDMPNGGYVKENGITVCNFIKDGETESCHMRVEKFHISNGEEWEEGLHPNDLYKMINSSYEVAIEKSNKL